MLRQLPAVAFLASCVSAYDQVLGFSSLIEYETRSLDQIYRAALEEGDTVTLWHGGDEIDQQDGLKKAFEDRFPGITLNVTVDLSKYHDGRIDQQLAAGKDAVYVDSVILQTLHDYPRWAEQGALLHYAPNGFEEIDHAFKDDTGAWYGVYVYFWSGAYNSDKLPNIQAPVEWEDFLRPEFKNKLVLAYPNDDDAVLWAFYLIMRQYGQSWFDRLVEQNPRWVRGSQTPLTLTSRNDTEVAAYFAASGQTTDTDNLHFTQPTQGKYVSWPQTAAILKDAPHPEGAKLLHNFILSPEYQATQWSVRHDIAPSGGLPNLWNETATNPAEFARFMADRDLVERLRFYFEARLGTPQGESPLTDEF